MHEEELQEADPGIHSRDYASRGCGHHQNQFYFPVNAVGKWLAQCSSSLAVLIWAFVLALWVLQCPCGPETRRLAGQETIDCP